MKNPSRYNSNVQAVVMRRVYLMHTIETFLAPTALAAFVFVLALWGIGREVWVAHVTQNFSAATHAGTLLTYLSAAFLDTRFIVQVLVVLTFATALWLAYNFVQLFRAQRIPAF